MKTLVAFVSIVTLAATTLVAAPSKQDDHNRLVALGQQLHQLKPSAAGSPEAASQYQALRDQYRLLSAQMGGDDPAALIGTSGAAAAGQPANAVPPTPLGCGPTTTVFTQATPTAVPTGPAVVTSTVVVSGVGTYLFDLDLTTNLTHTFAADLDITIQSPAGTVVTLTTDNGAGNDNVFNGTLWDDLGNPAGQVPYTTNNGLATDHAYVNLTTANPLVPEEAMGAFIGENPNGTWTITISDDLAGDGGSLDSWSLGVTTFPNAPITANTSATQSTPTAIPTGPAVVTSTLVVAGAGTSILDVDLTTFITHTFAADLDITIQSPAGTVVTLTTDNGAGNDNVFNGTVWDDDANPAGQVPYTTNNGLVTDHAYVNLTLASPLVPEEALAAFIGQDPNGTWTITISDDLAGDGGSLDSWSLDIDTFTCELADLSVTKDDGVASATPGTDTTYTIVVANAGPTAANPVSITDTFPAGCASVSYTSVAAGGASGNTVGPAAGNIADNAVNMPAGSSVTYTATCSIDPAATGSLSNTATVSSATADPNNANNSATDVDALAGSADLTMDKVLTTVGPIGVGDNAFFALTVTNNGPSAATGVVVTDTLPAGLVYVADDCGATFVDPTLTWNVGGLAPSSSATCNLEVTVVAPGMTTNTASATGNEADPVAGDNSSSATVVGQQNVLEIPTAGGVGLLAMLIALGMAGALMLRRRVS